MNSTTLHRLEYTCPYNWESMLAFLSRRATPGVESVNNNTYTRSFKSGQKCGFVEVCHHPAWNCLQASINFSEQPAETEILERIKSLFDLALNPATMLATLETDTELWTLAQQNPGLRKPGCWDGFEIAVRAITGQQISVVGATTVMGRIIAAYGSKTPGGFPVKYYFPTPEQLAELDPKSMSMPRARAVTIRTLARALADGELSLDSRADPGELRDKLLAIKGIGPWTAQYIAMRALDDADALLEGDLVLEKAAGRVYSKGARMPTRELVELANQWRPYRAYASLHLWEYAARENPVS